MSRQKYPKALGAAGRVLRPPGRAVPALLGHASWLLAHASWDKFLDRHSAIGDGSSRRQLAGVYDAGSNKSPAAVQGYGSAEAGRTLRVLLAHAT